MEVARFEVAWGLKTLTSMKVRSNRPPQMPLAATSRRACSVWITLRYRNCSPVTNFFSYLQAYWPVQEWAFSGFAWTSKGLGYCEGVDASHIYSFLLSFSLLCAATPYVLPPLSHLSHMHTHIHTHTGTTNSLYGDSSNSILAIMWCTIFRLQSCDSSSSTLSISGPPPLPQLFLTIPFLDYPAVLVRSLEARKSQ